MGRLWHVLIFSVMAVLGTLHQACDAGSQLQLGGYMVCSAETREAVGFASSCWAHFCFLQVCWVVLGPEDPWLHKGKNMGLTMRIGDVPLDVLLFARVLPLVALVLSFSHWRISYDGSSEDTWYGDWERGALLDNLLLFSGCVAWWLGSAMRRAQALDILLRVRFWARAGVRLLLPALLLFPVALASEVLRWRVLRAARHAGCSAIATAALAGVFRGKMDLADHALQNWLVVPWILLGTSLVFMATIFGAFAADGVLCRTNPMQCSHLGNWPTLSAAAESRGGHFVMAFGTPPLMLATAAMVWILDASPVVRPRMISDAASWSPWDRRLPWRLPSAPQKFRGSCRWLGCRFLYAAMILGTAAGLCMKEGPLRNALHVVVTVPFFASVWLAVVLCTASAENSTLFGLLRFVVTAAIAKGMLVLLFVFVIANQYIPNSLGIQPSFYAGTEYVVLMLVVLWPLTWMEDARAVRDPSTTQPPLDAISMRPRIV